MNAAEKKVPIFVPHEEHLLATVPSYRLRNLKIEKKAMTIPIRVSAMCS